MTTGITWRRKLGATFHLNDDTQIYGHWTRGYRSGGYNLRNTSFDPADTPGPFDEEEVNNYEIGYKSSHAWGKLNAAIFYNEIDDMQRELNLPRPAWCHSAGSQHRRCHHDRDRSRRHVPPD